MPRRSDTSDLTCALDANPVLDRDNVYFSDRGWAYRHFKNEARTEYWDEVLVAGQALLDNGDPDTTADPFGDPAPTFLLGDGEFSGEPLTIAPAAISVTAGDFTESTATTLLVSIDDSITDATYLWSTDEAGASFDDATSATPVLTSAAVLGNYTLTCVVTSATATDSPATVTFAYEVIAA